MKSIAAVERPTFCHLIGTKELGISLTYERDKKVTDEEFKLLCRMMNDIMMKTVTSQLYKLFQQSQPL